MRGEGREGRGRDGGDGQGAPCLRSPGCGTNQFSPNFLLGQSGAGSEEEFHSQRSGARLNAEQTGSPTAPPARITARAQLLAPSRHALWLRAGGRLRAGGSLTLPEAPVCPASHSAPSAHCPPTPTLAKRGGSWARWGPCCPTEDPAWPLPLAGLLPAAQSCPSPSAPGGRCVCLDTVSVP